MNNEATQGKKKIEREARSCVNHHKVTFSDNSKHYSKHNFYMYFILLLLNENIILLNKKKFPRSGKCRGTLCSILAKEAKIVYFNIN